MTAPISAVLLAAGESRRMAGTNKLLLPIDGVPLLRRSVLTLLQSMVLEIVVVLGHASRQVQPLIADLPVTICYNDRYADGQMSTVHTGLTALTLGCEGVMICLADQPLLTADDIDFLVAVFATRGTHSVVVPTYDGIRGNPIILSFAQREAILQNSPHLGCKHLVENHPEEVMAVPMITDHVVVDIDTREAYEAVQQRLAVSSAA